MDEYESERFLDEVSRDVTPDQIVLTGFREVVHRVHASRVSQDDRVRLYAEAYHSAESLLNGRPAATSDGSTGFLRHTLLPQLYRWHNAIASDRGAAATKKAAYADAIRLVERHLAGLSEPEAPEEPEGMPDPKADPMAGVWYE